MFTSRRHWYIFLISIGIPVPITFHDMFINIFNYIDQLVDIIRPQKLLYMAIDGVAPRAKLN